MFKSNFAKEVVENVRKSMTSLQILESRQRSREHDEDLAPPSPICNYLTLPNRRKLLEAEVHGSKVSSDFDEMLESIKVHDKRQSLNDSDMWMTSTQFCQLLDKEELHREIHVKSEPRTSDLQGIKRKLGDEFLNKKILVSKPESNSVLTSFLDENALVSFDKLKQISSELGFTISEQEWKQIRAKISFQEDNLVKNGDFFSVLNSVLHNKQGNSNKSSKFCNQYDNHLKDSMKSSDSGGELESCRSSDSGLESATKLLDDNHHANNSIRANGNEPIICAKCADAFDFKERELCDRERDLAQCYRDLAERDTDLVRVRMECQRLLEDNRALKESEMKLRIYSNPRKHLELEREVEHLKWQLTQMETSRKNYEFATQRLVSFLDEVTNALQASSPAHRKLVETTKAEVSRVARKTCRNKRSSLDSTGSASSLMSRAESMPGLNLEVPNHFGSFPLSRNGRNFDSSASNSSSRRVQRSQSTHSKRSPLPSLQEQDDQINPYENHSIIEMTKEEIKEETPEELEKIKRSISGSKSKASKSKSKGSPEKQDRPAVTSHKEEKPAGKVSIKTTDNDDTNRKRHSFLSNRSKSLAEVNRTKSSQTLTNKSQNTSDQDSGRCSLGSHSSTPSSSSGRSTPNVSVITIGKGSKSLKSNNDTKVEKEAAKEKLKKSGEKFCSLGNLQIEPSLPITPISPVDGGEDPMLNKAQKMLKSMKSLLAREKTLTITPKKSKSWKLQSNDSKKPPNLQLLSHTSFPGLPAFPVLAASHTSPWNC